MKLIKTLKFHHKIKSIMFLTMIKLTIMTITLENLFNNIMYLPVLSTDPSNFPSIANKINHNQETTIVEMLNNNLSVPV